MVMNVKMSQVYKLQKTTFCGMTNLPSTRIRLVEAILMMMVAKGNTSFTTVTTVHTVTTKSLKTKLNFDVCVL